MRITTMREKPAPTRVLNPSSGGISGEILRIVGTVLTLLAVVASGAAFSAALPAQVSPWLYASSYGAPAAVAFVAYWWVCQKL
jgi:hypothetical protein